MAYEHKLNKGSLFANGNKTGQNSPDYIGSANVDGKKLSISMWKSEFKDGGKYLSLSFKEWVDNPKSKKEPVDYQKKLDDHIEKQKKIQGEDDDSIPF